MDEKEFIRQLIVELIAHEVGHTLGLRHNFKGSTIHALDELHDRRVTDKEGISSSVMDYTRSTSLQRVKSRASTIRRRWGRMTTGPLNTPTDR